MKKDSFSLNWNRRDPEAKIGITSSKFTAVNNIYSLFVGLCLTGVFYALLYPLWQMKRFPFVDMFFHGGPENRSYVPYFTVVLSMWCLAFILIKLKKIKVQKAALNISIIPDDPQFVLSPDNSASVLFNIESQVYNAGKYIVFNRIQKALSNLKNIGRVSDVSSVLKDIASADESFIESTYILSKGLIWAIPVTGFIGTVLGLSQAVGGFGKVLASGADLDTLKNALSGVTGGLAVAFETTLIALIAALFLQLLLTLVMQKEETLMEECSQYCYRNLISKLKLIDVKDNDK